MRSRASLFLVVLTASLAVPVAAVAQGTGVTMEATAGLAGFVDVTRPVEVAVTITADLLFVGDVETRAGGSVVRRAVEVPAGTAKTYAIRIPTPVANQTVRVRLLAEGAEQPVATTSIQTRTADDEVLVGVAGIDLAGDLGRVRTLVADLAVVPIEIADLTRDLRPLGYLVVGSGADLTPEVLSWVEEGGRLVVEGASAASLDVEPLGAYPGTEVDWYALGAGEVLVADSLRAVGDDWPALIRPVPLVIGPRDVWQTPEVPLSNAASASGDQRIPALPWLFGSILAYAVVVGPVNLLLLRRLQRRDLAWVTVPLISLLAVIGFWIAGRSRLQTVTVTHASIVIADGPSPQARSGVIMAVGRAGSHEVTFADDWLVYPTQAVQQFDFQGRPIELSQGVAEGSTLRFELPQLGYAGMHAVHQPDAAPVARLLADGTTVEVTNDTGFEFWAWGVGSASTTRVASAALAPFSSGELGLNPGLAPQFGTNVADAVIQARQLWNDQQLPNLLYPLGEALGYVLDPGLGPYFFGFTDGYAVPLELDGEPRQVQGTTLVVVPLELTETVATSGVTTSQLVALAPDGFVDKGPGWFYVNAEEMTVRLVVPPGIESATLRFNQFFGERPSSLEVWDWETGGFRQVSEGDEVSRGPELSATGEMLLRALPQKQGEGDFVSPFPMSPNTIELHWGSS